MFGQIVQAGKMPAAAPPSVIGVPLYRLTADVDPALGDPGSKSVVRDDVEVQVLSPAP